MSSVILPANDERKKATPRGNHVKRCEIMPLLSSARNMHKAGAKGGAKLQWGKWSAIYYSFEAAWNSPRP